MTASQNGHTDVCRLLIENGAQLNHGLYVLISGIPTILAKQYAGGLLDIRDCRFNLFREFSKLLEKNRLYRFR